MPHLQRSVSTGHLLKSEIAGHLALDCVGGNLCSLALNTAGGAAGYDQTFPADDGGYSIILSFCTYTVSDTLIVSVDGVEALNTGPVATGSTSIDYSVDLPVNSTTVRIQVIAGGSTTLWRLTSVCIEPCAGWSSFVSAGDSKRGAVMDVTPGETVYPWIIAVSFAGHASAYLIVKRGDTDAVLWSNCASDADIGTGIVGVNSCIPIVVPAGVTLLVMEYGDGFGRCSFDYMDGNAIVGVDCNTDDCDDS